ncbi:MAG: hypothetical protein GDA44_15665, partial [Prochloron sp. SP5CPC1]|nr:hypothetical protein [Candidatus Paraprochloron terpiosi SP5CPC1]
SYTLEAGSGKIRKFGFDTKTYDELFGPGGFVNLTQDELYGAKIKITVEEQKAQRLNRRLLILILGAITMNSNEFSSLYRIGTSLQISDAAKQWANFGRT